MALPRVRPLALALLTACGGRPSAAPATTASASKPKPPNVPVQNVRVRSLLTVGDRATGPLLATRGDAALTVHVGIVEGPTGKMAHHLVARPVTTDGAPAGDARVVAVATPQTATLVVRPGGGASPGFVAAWTALADKGKTLRVIGIADDGSPRAAPSDLANSSNDIVWTDIVPTTQGALCVWAEQTRDGDANLLAAALDADGKLRGVPVRVARGVTGWELTKTSNGAALALIAADLKGKGGTLSWVRLDAEGTAMGAPILVTGQGTVSGDVHIAKVAERYLVAWTDRKGDRPSIMASWVDERGNVTRPTQIAGEGMGAALRGLASSKVGTVVAWAEPARRPRAGERIHVSRWGESSLSELATIEHMGRERPELSAYDGGVGLLVSARDCGADPTCREPISRPTFVRFDASLAWVQTEPVAWGEGSALAWNLHCSSARCIALGLSQDSPQEVVGIEVLPRETAKPAVASSPPEDAPRLENAAAVLTGHEFIGVAAADLAPEKSGASGTLVAALSAQGEVIVRLVDKAGRPKADAVTLSTRATPDGGISVARGGSAEDGAAVAWVAKDGGAEELHVARIDARGRRAKHVQVTASHAEARSANIVWADGGWLVGWIDSRAGNGEVFVTKINTELNRTSRQERVTTAPGDASDLTMCAHKDKLWLAWADPRETPKEGLADIYVGAVGTRDVKPAMQEVRVLASAAHSHSPAMARIGDDIAVSWIEEHAGTGQGAMIAVLEQGKVAAPAVRLKTAGEGLVKKVVLEGGEQLHALVARAAGDDLTLDAIHLTGPRRVSAIHTLEGLATLEVALSTESGRVFFNDEGKHAKDRRILAAAIDWR